MKAQNDVKIHVPAGFTFAATAAGIKASGNLDLAYAEAANGADAAAVFTKNRVVAAPVEIGREHLKRTGGRVRALIINSGNANCATGEAGCRACIRVCQETGSLLHISPYDVFPSSTGIIGVPLPVEKIAGALPQLLAAQQTGEEGLRQFARAIMTTDTRPKIASVALSVGDRMVNVAGVAKGAGMIHPQLATMLVYIFTDLQARAVELKPLLRKSCDRTFNCISVDHDTSTNDTVLLLASGASGVRLRIVRKQFAEALTLVCQSLSEQIVSDGEGVKHVVRLYVEQARNRDEALTIARAISGSPLVKTAWAGCDPNWGRILAAIGYSGVRLDPTRVNIFIGGQQVCRKGVAHPFDQKSAHEYMSQPSYDIRVQLGRGRASLRYLTCDLTKYYVEINAEYST
ncbi:MAG: bifunctional glutamate N-acetyltransferase/amino-acid acetyltransferase ArgJ [Terriglobales bacterium]